MGACLAQYDEAGIERPIEYAAKSLNSSQRNYGITDRECTALIFALRRWRHLISSSVVICVTDHSAAKSLANSNKTFDNVRLANYAVEMGEHDVIMAWRPGRILFMADMLSRAEQEGDKAKVAELTRQAWGMTDRARNEDVSQPGGRIVQVGGAERASGVRDTQCLGGD